MSTVNVATLVELPYDPAVTPVVANERFNATSAVPLNVTPGEVPSLPTPPILKVLLLVNLSA